MKNKVIVYLSLLVIMISFTGLIGVQGKKDNLQREELILRSSGDIPGWGWVYYELLDYDPKYGLSWSFSGVSNTIDVWLFEETEYNKFAVGQACDGYHLGDADDNWLSDSGRMQFPENWDNDWYLVFYNPHLLFVHYNDIYCGTMEIHLQIDSVTFTPIDNDNDGFDNRLKATIDVSFNTNYWTEGGISVSGYLYDGEGKIVDTRGTNYQFIENDETISFEFQIRGTGQYTAKIKVYFFLAYGGNVDDVSDDTFESTESYKLYGEGHLTRILIWGGVGGGGAIVILIITILIIVSMMRKKRAIIPHVEESQAITQEEPISQPTSPPPPETLFCWSCGTANKQKSLFCIKCGSELSKPE